MGKREGRRMGKLFMVSYSAMKVTRGLNHSHFVVVLHNFPAVVWRRLWHRSIPERRVGRKAGEEGKRGKGDRGRGEETQPVEVFGMSPCYTHLPMLMITSSASIRFYTT